jgi:hypothetical protein
MLNIILVPDEIKFSVRSLGNRPEVADIQKTHSVSTQSILKLFCFF